MAVKISDERPRRPRPFRRHAVARQVARHEVQQAGHRRRAGEPQNRDRAEVVDRAERLAEVLVREVRQRAAVGLAALLRTPPAGSAASVTNAAADEQHAHDERRRAQQLLRVADAARRADSGSSPGSPLHERHHGDAGLEPRQAERQLRERQ